MRYRNVFAFLILLATAQWSEGAETNGAHSWHSDLSGARKEVATTQRPMLLMFTMDGCSFCQLMKKSYSEGPVANQVRRGFVAARINGRNYPKLAQRLKVRVYPTTFIVSQDNRVLDRIDGYLKSDELSERLSRVSETDRTPGKPVKAQPR